MKLREFREYTGKTQAEIASVLNVSRQTYNFYETGRREPNIDTLVILAHYYGTTIDDLVGNSYESPQLTPIENELIEIFRPLSEENKYQVLGMIRLLAYQQDQNVQIEEEGNVG